MTIEQYLRKFNGKKIALLGLGLENRALLALLEKYKIRADITIKDSLFDPDGFNRNLYRFDILFRSPGWPLSCPGIKEAIRKRKTEISSPLNLFFSLCPTKNIIGVTGTKGKGTTASLIYKILKDAGKKVWLGGNIGISPLSFLTKIKKSDYVVLELSSFQLEDLKSSPRIAVFTNLYKEHLAPADPNNPNFHTSFAGYFQAKMNIARWPENEYLVANRKLEKKLSAFSRSKKLSGKKLYFSSSPLLSNLVGSYNQENIGAALKVADILKINKRLAETTAARFKNLEHRLEFVREINGVRYFDNSFSTTPESTILDLQSWKVPIIQIAGGADKGADFRPLAETIKQKVKFLILLPGKATPRIKKELRAAGLEPSRYKEAADMKTAVKLARQKAAKGDIVLLSTACASFGIFKNYKERGDLFKKYVKE